MPRLGTGTYKVSFGATSQNLVAEYYNQKPYRNEATGVAVSDSAGDRSERLHRRPRVVVDFNEEPAWVVTALVQNNSPRGWQP